MPHHSGWVAAFVLTLLLAAVGAASERDTLSAAAIHASGSAKLAAAGVAEVEADASAHASVRTPDLAVSPPPRFEHAPRDHATRAPPPPPAEENATREEPPADHTSNETRADAAPLDAPVLSPRHQELSGTAGMPVRFVVLMTNSAKSAQNVTLTSYAPTGWEVQLTPRRAHMGADETVAIHGTIVTPRLVGAWGTVSITAKGADGSEFAYVDLCTDGDLLDGCDPRRAERISREASDNTTHADPPANGSAPPEENATAQPAPEPAPAPAPTPAPAAEESAPASNESATSPPPEQPRNATRPSRDNATGNATAGSGNGLGGASAAGAEAWLEVEVAASGRDEGEP